MQGTERIRLGRERAFTHYLAVPARLLHRIPDDLSYPEATLLQPSADIVHAVVTNTRIRPGGTVVILGPGPMGMLTAQVAKAVGAGQVIMVGLDRHQERLEIARNVGADFVINRSKEDLVVHFINMVAFKMAPEIPPHLPLRKGGEQYPPFG